MSHAMDKTVTKWWLIVMRILTAPVPMHVSWSSYCTMYILIHFYDRLSMMGSFHLRCVFCNPYLCLFLLTVFTECEVHVEVS